jgi:hypothetical protein
MSIQSFLSDHPVLDVKQMHQMLRLAGIDSQLDENQLTIQNDSLTTVMNVVPTYGESLDSGPVSGLLHIRTDISEYVRASPDPHRCVKRLNGVAAMGAAYRDERGYAVGSRLTIRAGARSEPLLLSLVFSSAIGAAPGMIEAVARVDRHQPPVDTAPGEWTISDLEKTASFLSRLSLCTSDEGGVTAQFSVVSDAIFPTTGDDRTGVRWQLRINRTHPAIGGGLFASLELSSQTSDAAQRKTLVEALNRREMDGLDSPPHFGAWVDTENDARIVYTTFLPNELRAVKGLATKLSFWALNRALWVSSVLSKGVDL